MLSPGDRDRKSDVVPARVDVGEVPAIPGKPVLTTVFTQLFGAPKGGQAGQEGSLGF